MTSHSRTITEAEYLEYKALKQAKKCSILTGLDTNCSNTNPYTKQRLEYNLPAPSFTVDLFVSPALFYNPYRIGDQQFADITSENIMRTTANVQAAAAKPTAIPCNSNG